MRIHPQHILQGRESILNIFYRGKKTETGERKKKIHLSPYMKRFFFLDRREKEKNPLVSLYMKRVLENCVMHIYIHTHTSAYICIGNMYIGTFIYGENSLIFGLHIPVLPTIFYIIYI
jgi:hypothetical protein